MISACILAGGRARRMGGRSKPTLEKHGATILERQLDVLAPRAVEVLVAIARGAAPLAVPERWAATTRFVEDEVEGAGPLAGVAAALEAARADWVLVVAGDLPNLAGALVDLLISEIGDGDDVDAVAPRVGGLPEPLFACYHRRAAAVARARLAAGRRKAAGLLTDEHLRVRWIDEAALRARDPALASLDDVDTPDDLVRWRDH